MSPSFTPFRFPQLILLILTGSCATPKAMPAEEVSTPHRSHYEIRWDSDFKTNPEPLPAQRSGTLLWRLSDNSAEPGRNFRGWDINMDGRLDMLEVLDDKGDPEAFVYDFNFDGTVDLVKQRSSSPNAQ